MSNESLYVYGIVKSGFNLDWKEQGIEKENVYSISEGKFSALVHNCEQKAYVSQDIEKIKELIIAHNMILDRAMEDFDGVIPLSFNTIIKKNENPAYYNLKKWLNDDQGRLERIWNKVKCKKEYGLRIYFEKNKLIEGVSNSKEIKKIEKIQEEKGQGLRYLLQTKAKAKIDEIVQERINQLKQKFCNEVKEIAEVKVNISRIGIKEEKDLLLGLSILTNKEQIGKIKEYLEKKENQSFSFQLVGPFAPYSFVKNDKK